MNMKSNQEMLEELTKEGLFLKEGFFNPSYVKKFNRTITPERKEWYDSVPGEGLSEKIYNIIHNNILIPTCKACEKKVSFVSFREGYREFCCNSCRSKYLAPKVAETNLKKYGTKAPAQNKEVLEKMKKTTLERFGVENVFKDKDKIKKSVKAKYGVDNPMKNPESVNKLKDSIRKTKHIALKKRVETNLSKYGVSCTLHAEGISDKVSAVKKNNVWDKLQYDPRLKDVTILFSKDDYRGTLDITIPVRYKFKCNACSLEFETYLAWNREVKCPSCFPSSRQGRQEKELYDWIKDYAPDAIANTRSVISPLELDIYIPSKNLAIEFDEIYWHSENTTSRGKDYHINKTKLCEAKGINLVHIFDSEWELKQDIVKSILLSKLGIYSNKIGARKCIIQNVTTKESAVFLNENHIQGYAFGTIRKGLYYNSELISLLVVSPNRFKKGTYEIVRFIVKKNTSVPGALSKLWKEASKEIPENVEVVSYADKRFFSGKSNEVIGLKYQYDNKPQYYYTDDYTNLYNRMGFQKKRLKERLKEYDESFTEWENMQLNGYDRIWDCGTAVFSTKS